MAMERTGHDVPRAQGALLRSRLFWGLYTFVLTFSVLSILPTNARPSDPAGLSIVASIIAMLIVNRRHKAEEQN